MSTIETCKRTACVTNNAMEMLNGVFSDKADSKSRGDTGLRHLVVGLNKVIWDYRCKITFE